MAASPSSVVKRAFFRFPCIPLFAMNALWIPFHLRRLIAMTRSSVVDGYRGLNSSRLAELRMATTAGCCSFRSTLMA
jgi:hypothetical protein